MHVPSSNAFISCSECTRKCLVLTTWLLYKCTHLEDACMHVYAHTSGAHVCICRHTHTHVHAHKNGMSWSLRVCVNHPLLSPPHYEDDQPQDVYTRLSRGHLGIFTWLEWMHSGGVDVHNSSATNMCSALNSYWILSHVVWVSSTICTFHTSQLHQKENCDGQTCWRLLSLMYLNSLKICNLHIHHQLVILLPISVFLFNFARIIHWKSIHF